MSNVTVSAVEEFKRAWFSGMESLLKACQIYVKAIDEDVVLKDMFIAACPQIMPDSWARIEAVGRGSMHHLLLCDSTDIGAKLRKLPYSEQKKAIDIGFEILTDTGDTLKVKAENLTSKQIKQVIAKDHIRDIAGQKSYIESKKDSIVAIKYSWSIIGKGKDKRARLPGGDYKKEELQLIIQDMK